MLIRTWVVVALLYCYAMLFKDSQARPRKQHEIKLVLTNLVYDRCLYRLLSFIFFTVHYNTSQITPVAVKTNKPYSVC